VKPSSIVRRSAPQLARSKAKIAPATARALAEDADVYQRPTHLGRTQAHARSAPPSEELSPPTVRVAHLLRECEPHLVALEKAHALIEKANARALGGGGRSAMNKLFAAHDEFLHAKYEVWQRLGPLDSEQRGGELSPADRAQVLVALARLGACVGAVRGILY
jgi:hypothetical protein